MTGLRPLLLLALTTAALGVAPCLPAAAQGKPTPAVQAAGPSWASLTATQRQALAPLERDWPSIDEPRKAKWLDVAARFHKLPADEQQRVQQRMTEWARMSPAERGRARLNFQESKQFSAEEKQERWEAYQALPAEQRKALADRPRLAADAAASRPSSTSRPAGPTAQVKPVTPTVVQAKPGATTTLITQQPAPPHHQHLGQPTIAAKPGQVDSTTLLPKSGPQAAPAATVSGKP